MLAMEPTAAAQSSRLRDLLREAVACSPNGDVPETTRPPHSASQMIRYLHGAPAAVPPDTLTKMVSHTLSRIEDRDRKRTHAEIDSLQPRHMDLASPEAPRWVLLPGDLRTALVGRYGAEAQAALLNDCQAARKATTGDAIVRTLQQITPLAVRCKHWQTVLDIQFGCRKAADPLADAPLAIVRTEPPIGFGLVVNVDVQVANGPCGSTSGHAHAHTHWQAWLRMESTLDQEQTLHSVTLAEDLRMRWGESVAELPEEDASMLERIATRDLHFTPPVVLRGRGCFARIVFKLARAVYKGQVEIVPPTLRLVRVDT